MDILKWLEEEFKVEECTMDKFIYNDLESQSGRRLPVIYVPFDSKNKFHWLDRGCLYDFLYSTDGEGKKLLDFGPGDGWPSLIVAPYAKEVIGLDSSQKRVEICRKNAKRLGINNATFISYTSGEKLPFNDDTFDGIMAASSVEQTSDPKATLTELYRVLKPGGRFRISYEGLNRYKNGYENEVWIAGLKDKTTRIILYDRKIEEEYALQYGISLSMGTEELNAYIKENKGIEHNDIGFEDITIEFLEKIRGSIIDVKKSKTIHPSGKTYAKWMKEIGFKEVVPSHGGNRTAINLYEENKNNDVSDGIEHVDEIIKPIVKVVCKLEAPIEKDPNITAIK